MGIGVMRKRARGFAFVAALMVMLVMAILAMAILTMAASARLLSGSRQEYTQALYVAEAGINDLMSRWRDDPSLPEQSPQYHDANLANGPDAGAYHVVWTWPPDERGVVVVTSQGTANTDLPGTVFHLSRTVQVALDTDGDWAWNHVYYSDTDLPGMTDPPYATIQGNVEVEVDGEAGSPEEFLDHANGPSGGGLLPSPMWDLWHDWVQYDMSCDPVSHEQIPRDPNGDGIPDPRWPDQGTLPAYTTTSVAADPTRHVYWYGSSSSTPLDCAAHGSDSHAAYDQNFFMPDWYGVLNPDAYVCNSSNKRFTVTFGSKQAENGVYTGNYLVHGDIHIKNHAQVRGTLIATGNVVFYGVDNITIAPEAVNPDAPCDERVYYPAIIAGNDVVVRDQGVNPGDPDRSRLRVSGVIWAGGDYWSAASDVQGCVVSPNVRLSGNSLVRYGAYLDGCLYLPGDNPPPWFREPDRGEMQPVPRSWREL